MKQKLKVGDRVITKDGRKGTIICFFFYHGVNEDVPCATIDFDIPVKGRGPVEGMSVASIKKIERKVYFKAASMFYYPYKLCNDGEITVREAQTIQRFMFKCIKETNQDKYIHVRRAVVELLNELFNDCEIGKERKKE